MRSTPNRMTAFNTYSHILSVANILHDVRMTFGALTWRVCSELEYGNMTR
jgi:hypothetical protein